MEIFYFFVKRLLTLTMRIDNLNIVPFFYRSNSVFLILKNYFDIIIIIEGMNNYNWHERRMVQCYLIIQQVRFSLPRWQ